MELNNLLNKTAPVTIEYDGETINAVVYSDRLTPQKKAELINLLFQEGEEQKEEEVLMLSELIESWDVTLNGEAFPPTYDNLMQISYPLLSHVVREVASFLKERGKPKPQAN